MKKALVFLLTLVLLIGLIPTVAVFAVEEDDGPSTTAPVAVSSPAGFAAMLPNGSYYLTCDITLDATYAGKFSGTFDGKGFTVTTSVPMFTELDATVSNLTIKGAVTSASGNLGALANDALGGKYTAIKNEATVTGGTAKSADLVGGLFGHTVKDSAVTVELVDCLNTAAVTGYYAGGFIGKSESQIKITTSVNLGDITSVDGAGGMCGWPVQDFVFDKCANGAADKVNTNKASTDGAGGFVGYISAKTTGLFTECVNYGTVIGDKAAGGLAGAPGKGCTLTFTGCTNYGAVTGKGDSTGGLVGLFRSDADNPATATFTDCANHGPIVTEVDTAGGILGYAQGSSTVSFKNCLNTASVQHTDATGGNYPAAGICGHAAYASNFENCLNTGDITNTYYGAAGIIGNANGPLTITDCGNTGKITATGDTGAGVVSYLAGSKSKTTEFKNCFNTGDVTGADCVSGILGYVNGTSELKFTNCINTGKLKTTHSGYKACAIYYSKYGTDLPAENLVNVAYLEGCADYASHYLAVTGKDAEGNDIKEDKYAPMAATLVAADVASGKLCYMLNQVAGEEIFFQTLGTDAAPTLDNTHKSVILEGDVYKNPAEAPETPPTGDNIALIAALAVVSVAAMLGMAYRASRKERA